MFKRANNPLYWGKLDAISSAKFRNISNLKNVKESFFGSAPAPFIGRYGYPRINVGILSPSEIMNDADNLDAQRQWAKNNLDIPEIVGFRSQLINSRDKAHVKDKNKLLEIAQEVALSKKAVDLEINLKKKPTLVFKTDPYLAPHAANAQIKSAVLADNPKIPRFADKIIDDDLLANKQLIELNKKFDEHYLSKILSVGLLGKEKSKKLVPTRWSITATDDTLGKNNISEIKQFRQNEEYLMHFGGYLGNYYAILFFPEIWSYELFEIYAGDSDDKGDYMTDHESYNGRKDYASNTVGGYYACRLAITEKLKEKKRQASVLALRFITDEYTTPLGVWVVREATRKSLESSPISFASKELMFSYLKYKINSTFSLDADKFLNLSKILTENKAQKKLFEF